MPDYYDPAFKSKLIYPLARLCKTSFCPYNLFFKVSYENTDRIPRDSPFIMVAPHYRFSDPPLITLMLWDTINKHPYYIMRSSLGSWFDLIGGIRVMREKDMKNLSKDEKKSYLKEAQKLKYQANRTIVNVLARDHFVVVHPEGTRHHPMPSPIDQGTPFIALRNLLALQENVKKYNKNPIKWVPLDINYGEYKIFREPVILSVGKTLETDNLDELINHLIFEISSFSRSP